MIFNDFFSNERFNVLAMYLHRYLRTTPLMAVCALMCASIVRYFGSGPLWPERVPILEKNCDQFWWSMLLYAQNYVNPEQRVSNNKISEMEYLFKFFKFFTR